MLRRLAFASPLLLAASAPALAAELCPVETGVQDIFGEPALRTPVASNRPVIVLPGAVVAEEQMQVSTRIWRSDQPVVLTGRAAHTYPAGSPVTALRSEQGERRCLRDATSTGHGPSPRRLLPCLIDADGDGLYEAAEIFSRDAVVTYFGRRARFRRISLSPLASPVRLVEDAGGLETGRMVAIRRVQVVEAGLDTAVVEIVHGSLAAWRLDPVALTGADGRVNRYSRSRQGSATQPDLRPWPGSRRTVPLADGATETIGGMPFRIGRASDGWTMTPLAERFPRWIHYDCEGSTIRIGRP
jgi:hypothetical protein